MIGGRRRRKIFNSHQRENNTTILDSEQMETKSWDLRELRLRVFTLSNGNTYVSFILETQLLSLFSFRLMASSRLLIKEMSNKATVLDVDLFWKGEQSSTFSCHVKKIPNPTKTPPSDPKDAQNVTILDQPTPDVEFFQHRRGKNKRQAPLTANVWLLTGLCWISKPPLDCLYLQKFQKQIQRQTLWWELCFL